jgi:hypothetical protein
MEIPEEKNVQLQPYACISFIQTSLINQGMPWERQDAKPSSNQATNSKTTSTVGTRLDLTN